ncbi:MAG TPA: protein-glutamate O-methyltransferase CheR [Syntrophorhabdus sp.]|nr:protein-glutamate O-methyltransferase CheR [Syntrophorhabdus sp.]MDI9558527.1 protein-glutamate O-methyltransferase CheR [Pseudomonadota bacterium]OPX94434.1 MAG: Chemotaxis protein methyltransferase [Syntrophorhabdus sp. PtaB.Bin027]OQB77995.1 MAG: Chemotaxis protein methyltransferase [Deltaproteobacteria bacterium ADurb.Bin135]MBP8743720.1 protein-glutamate O-methyltransferase CheR [Syntrophorhabdus sp.]
MTKEEFVLLRDYVYEKSGIHFAENKAYLLESRLSNRLTELGFSNFEDYYYFLKYGGDKVRSEIINLFNAVTTNETSFFRNPPQLDAFKVIVHKCYLQNGIPSMPIRIWCAACSTGEEPYTLVMILLEMMENLKKNIPFSVFGTDISTKALESAKKAHYNMYSIRNMGESIRQKYFVEKDGSFILKENVKKYVKIDFMNLMDTNAYKMYKQMDFIFCRNVLIYFDEKMKKKVIDSLYESLKLRGYLTIGHAESLHNISRAFKPLIFPGTIAYQKG